VRGPLAVIVFGGIASVAIYAERNAASVKKRREQAETIRMNNLSANIDANISRGTAVEHRRKTSTTAAAVAPAGPAPIEKPAPAPSVPVEEVFRTMNTLANESNGGEFKKHMATKGGPLRAYGLRHVISRDFSNAPIAARMEPFFGRILLLKSVPEPEWDSRQHAQLFAAIQRNDNTTGYAMFWFTAQDGEWRYSVSGDPDYRASSRIEFRPEKGDAAAILRTHLGANVTFAPVPGANGQFDITQESDRPDHAAAIPKGNVRELQNSLRKAGLDAAFKIISPATKPEKPWMAEEAPAPKNNP